MTSLQIAGHRGAKGEAPENTVAGIRYARRLGLSAVEFDVRLSRDYATVVIHDGTVDRTTDASGPVAEFTARQLAELDARGTYPSWPERVGVPTLAQVMDVLDGFTDVQIEIKSDTPARLETITAGVLEQIHERSTGPQVIITSFDPVAIGIVQRIAPSQARAFIGRPDDAEIVDTSLRLGCTQANFHQFRARSADEIQRAHNAGLRVGGGPCDSIEDLDVALAWNMDSVTSDLPSDLIQHLSST